MKKKVFHHLKNTLFMLAVLLLAFFASLLLQDVFDLWEHITTVFVFAVFLVSLGTDGFLYGLIATMIGVFAVNYAFTFPYFHVDFTDPTSIFSAIAMLIFSVLTSGLTAKLKKWEALKAEGERERMRADLLRAVSHDLRTPLTTIYGASSSILENFDKLSDGQKIKMIGGMQEDAEWMIRMVENLLSVTRIDSGSVKLIKTPTVLEELVDTAVLKFKKRYPKELVEITLPEELVVIPMDAILIEQVLINLMENAVHHAVGRTHIELTVALRGEVAEFTVADDGCGIPKDRLERIFTGQLVGRGSAVDTHKRNAGIGLSVCAGILRAHGGTITAENARGGGAVFRFTLKTEETESEQSV